MLFASFYAPLRYIWFNIWNFVVFPELMNKYNYDYKNYKNDFGSDIHCYRGSLEVQRLLIPEMMSADARFPITLPYLH